VDIADGTELLERGADAISIGVEREISDVQTSIHRLLYMALRTHLPTPEGPGHPKWVSNRKTQPTEHRERAITEDANIADKAESTGDL
jgi:hypothetical protein